MHDSKSTIFYQVLRMATLRAHGHGTPFTTPVKEDGIVTISEQLLSLRFHFRIRSMYVEKEIFDDNGMLTETILQLKCRDTEGFAWTLSNGTYGVFGLSDSQMSVSTILVTPPTSTSTVQVPALAKVKIEGSLPHVHVISDSDDDIVPEINLADTSVNIFVRRPSVGSSRSLPLRGFVRSPSISSGRPPVHPASRKPRSIL